MNASQDSPEPPSNGAESPPPLARVMDLVRFLRANCAWDAAQTPQSLLPYMLEEAHEVAEAVEDGDESELAAELGDLMLHLAFQLVLAEERESFTDDEVAERVIEKMRRRHPHIYGEGETEAEQWEALKERERKAEGRSVLDGLARGLDPLSRAHRIQERVSAVGFDWEHARDAFEKVAEEVEEVRQALEDEPSPALEEEIGDLLFSIVNLTRLAGTHAMHALQRANRKFTGRFDALERLAAERGISLEQSSLQELDALWDEVKQDEPVERHDPLD